MASTTIPDILDQASGSRVTLLLSNIISTLVVLYLCRALYYGFVHPLNSVPGPSLARFSRAWRNIRYFRGTWHDDIVELHRRYGPVVRIAPNEVSFVDEGALKQVYGFGKPNQKSTWYYTWRLPGFEANVFGEIDRNMHRRFRGRIRGAYSMAFVMSVEGRLQEVFDVNWQKLRDMSRQGAPVDLSALVNFFTFDAVAQVGMGGMMGFVEKQTDVDGLIKAIHSGFYISANFGDMPLQTFWFNNPVSQWITDKIGVQDLKCFKDFVVWLDGRIGDRMVKGPDPDHGYDMLQHFIESKNPDGTAMRRGEILGESAAILAAGADTTGAALLAILGQLLEDAQALRRLRDEVDNAYSRLGLGEGSEIGFKEAEKLPFLTAVIRESMRLHPSVSYQLPRACPDSGLEINGHHIPKSVVCGISPVAMNRSEEIFGKDASKFNPDRWIASTGSEVEVLHIQRMEGNLTTFGMGSRSCAGQNLAMVEIYKYVAQFVRHFDAELVNKDKPWESDSKFIWFQSQFWVTLKERKVPGK